jgi:hypothetical protein
VYCVHGTKPHFLTNPKVFEFEKNCVKTKTQNSEIEKRVLKPSPREHPNRYIYTHTYRYIVRIETRGSLKEEGLDNTGLNVPLLATTKEPQFLWITLYSSFQFHHQTSSFWVTFVPSLFFCVSSSVQTRLMSAQSKQCFFLSYKHAKVTTKSQLCTKWCEKLENYENGAGPWTPSSEKKFFSNRVWGFPMPHHDQILTCYKISSICRWYKMMWKKYFDCRGVCSNYFFVF